MSSGSTQMSAKALTTLMIAATLGLAACGGDEPTPQEKPPTADMSGDLGAPTPDHGEQPDQSTPEPDMAKAPDAGREDMSSAADQGGQPDQGQPCDPKAEAAKRLGVHEGVAQATMSAQALDDGSTRVVIDAGVGGPQGAATSSFVYVSLGQGVRHELSDKQALTSPEWQLGLKRTELRINSADSGPGQWMLSHAEGTSWEQARPPAPGPGWRLDEFISDTCEVKTFGRGTIETAFGQWYDYDPQTHSVSAPAGVIYFLYHAQTHEALKLQIEGYEAGVYTLRWAKLGR